MLEVFLKEYQERHGKIIDQLQKSQRAKDNFQNQAIHQLEFIIQFDKDVQLLNQLAEMYHLEKNLKKANEYYQMVLIKDKLLTLTKDEKELIRKYCPIFHTTQSESFELMNIIGIHHPTKNLIGYHIFWEDDFDFPDDFEPCDHEEVWIEYDAETLDVLKVHSFFHSRVISSTEAAKEANENGGRAIIRVEWGKHGSLLKDWENIIIDKDFPVAQWIQQSYSLLREGGRLAEHPLKKDWPSHFEGTYEDFINFNKKVDPINHFKNERYMFKTQYSNAVIFTHGLRYNFHPKMEWPARYNKIL